MKHPNTYKKLRAFTLSETLIALSISSFVIVLVVSSYLIISKQFNNYKKTSNQINKVFNFISVLENDLNKYPIYEIHERTLFLESFGHKLSYMFEPTQIIRTIDQIPDTILQNSSGIDFNYETIAGDQTLLDIRLYLKHDTITLKLIEFNNSSLNPDNYWD